jgi:hypothetical protein
MNENEPIACWCPSCYLAIDEETGACEAHGRPPATEPEESGIFSAGTFGGEEEDICF